MKATIITLENESGVYEHLKILGSPEDLTKIVKLINEAMSKKIERIKSWDINKEEWSVKVSKINRMHDLLEDMSDNLIEVGGSVERLKDIL